ncbi:MAG: ABC transporter ATP-binding protein [Deltaproteobacteria bacterium]|nr:ABC transporter ATP-binding protein [Deltaproteobacteria bacterium]
MTDIAIRVENLSKRYRIVAVQNRHDTLREAIVDTFQRFTFQRSNVQRSNDSYIWALKDVSFEVQRGEVVGIIGRNGAGKTTLLKILSRITRPTEGRAIINGRVGSLLEVGTGFHPELTGRENITLNGAILGMKKAEIDRKFDEIVAFAEIEKFIDTPVKHYSSGMYVRLAFAVAAHLEPEILLVDEVLAVGDAAFQKKCLGKMGEVSQEGRTVLFVSHNMAAIASLCERAIVLDAGRIQLDSRADNAIGAYLSSLEQLATMNTEDRTDRIGDQMVRCSGIWLEDQNGRRVGSAVSGQLLKLCLQYESKLANPKADFAIGIYGRDGDSLIHCNTAYSSSNTDALPKRGIVTCTFPKLPLPEGRYRVNFSIWHQGERVDHLDGALVFTVDRGDFYGTGKTPPAASTKVLAEHFWHFSHSVA